MKHYTIYQTTNLINNKIYIGLHTTDNINDGYLGSGIFLKKAIKKYGYINFKKEILHVFDNKKDMITKEKEIVNEDFILRKDTYNMAKGSYGLSTLSSEKRKIAIEKMKITKQSQDLKSISDKRLITMLNDDPDCFKKIAIKSAQTQKENYLNGYINPRQTNNQIKIYNHNGKEIYSTLQVNFKDLCLKNNLPKRVLEISFKNNGTPIYLSQNPRSIDFMKYKGWYAIKIDKK